MNIEELFDNEIYHNYGMLTTDDANLLTNYLKEEVMEYVAGLQKQIERIAELELRLGCCRDASAGKDLLIAKLEAKMDAYRHANNSKAARIEKMREEYEEDAWSRKQYIAELELRLGCCRDASTGKDLLITELEATNKELMCAMRECACEPSRIVENGIGGMTLETQAARSLIDKARDMYEKHNGGEA